jgi:hypothetical protein
MTLVLVHICAVDYLSPVVLPPTISSDYTKFKKTQLGTGLRDACQTLGSGCGAYLLWYYRRQFTYNTGWDSCFIATAGCVEILVISNITREYCALTRWSPLDYIFKSMSYFLCGVYTFSSNLLVHRIPQTAQSHYSTLAVAYVLLALTMFLIITHRI